MKIVVENEVKIRLDKYLSENTEYSRSLITKMIDEGFILVNDKIEKSSYILKENDVITINDGYKTETDIVPEDIPIDIVYEDDDVLVVNKESGMVVHPGSGNNSHTLVNALMFHTNKLSDINGDIRPGIVHRIDKDTSGLILVAKTNKAHEILADDFQNKRVKREYIALLKGVFPRSSATIDAPIGRDKVNRKKMCVTGENSKRAVSHMEVIEKYDNYTLARFILETGRTHQIRVHAAYIGFPVFNDPVYTKDECDSFGQFLHSAKLTFTHPITKKELHFESELPSHFTDFLKKIDK